MTLTDMQDIQADVLDAFQYDVSQPIIYRHLTNGTVSDGRFGFVKTKVSANVTLWALVIMNPVDKIKKTFGVSGDCNLLVYLATKQLADLTLTLERENGTFAFQGVEYEIDKITPFPLMADTSLFTVVGCKESKPNV